MQSQLIAGRYKVLRAIGRGGMGTVWLCRDEVLGREVAVKQIGALPGESATETKRAMREARSAAALNHPNAVAVYDVVDHGGLPWLVMEYVEGQTLADEISRDGQLSPQRVADIGAQLAGALARAHERRIVHRDIKPGNVLIDQAGRPKISDFGIARGQGDEQLTQVGFITGTPGFLSPELARGGDPHSASDVWALGATLYAAVEGQPPYEPKSNPLAVLRAIATERPRPMTHAGVLAPAIDAMMHEDPARRWDMATSANRLRGIARITTVIPRPERAQSGAIAVSFIEPTQALAATQRLEAAATAVTGQSGVPPVTAAPVAPMPVTAAPAAAESVAAAGALVPAKPAAGALVPAKPAAGALVPMAAKTAAAEPAGALVPTAKTTAAGRPRGQGPRQPLDVDPALPLPDGIGVRRWLPLGLVVVLLGVLGGVFLLSQTGHQSGAPAGPTTRIGAVRPRVTGTPKNSGTPSATSSTKIRATAVPAHDANKKLADFVKSYYSDVTGNADRTWARLTPKMQGRAGGRQGYDNFWRTIDKVEVNRTQANAATKTAVVNLTFTRKDQSRSTENHRFTFVTDGGSFLIETDRFLG